MSRAEEKSAVTSWSASAPRQRFPGMGCACLLGILACARTAVAQWDPDEALVTRSISGQFLVYSPRALESLSLDQQTVAPTNSVRLDPALLPVSCERIKQVLWRELGATAPWQGKIFLNLRSVRERDPTPSIISERFRNAWRYRVELPNEIERVAYVRAMVQVLLLEMANRKATERSAEVPTWLVEGLTRQLLASNELEIILQPPGTGGRGLRFTPTFFNARKDNPLHEAHSEITGRKPLTFEQLSWPAPGQLTGDGAEQYAGSAQLFVNRLMRLENGRNCLRAMVEMLPSYYNWQFAFLQAFSPWFQRPLDVEKWWTVTALHFSERDLAQNWPAAESWEKLDQVLRAPIEVRSTTNEMPLRSEVPLQTVINEWSPAQQEQVLNGKLRELEFLRLRVATNFVGIVDGYHETLRVFLADKERSGLIPFRKRAIRQNAAQRAVENLNQLDASRAALRHARMPSESHDPAVPKA